MIQAYHRETIVNLRLRYKIGFFNENEKCITWSSHHTVYNKGYYPRIAMNDKGMVVTVFASQIGKQIYYRLGKLRCDDDSVDLSTAGSSATLEDPLPNEVTINSASIEWSSEKVPIGEGRNVAVSISSSNMVIIVYESDKLRVQTYYRIGDISGHNIIWRKEEGEADSLLIESGFSRHASVAVNDTGQVVVGYSSAVVRDVHYVAGQISNNTIVLGGNVYSPPGANYQPVVSLNNRGHVAAVHHTLQGRLYLKINHGLLSADPNTGQSIVVHRLGIGDSQQFCIRWLPRNCSC